MKPKEIRKWFLLLTIAVSFVSSEYCSGDKTDTIKYERQKESQNSVEQSFRDNDSHRLTSRVLTHRFQARNTRGFDFIREKVSHRSESPNVVKTIRNQMRQNVQVTRRREIPNILNYVSFFRSNEVGRYAARDHRSLKKSDSVVDMSPIRKSQRSQISSKVDTITPKDQANTRTIIRQSDKLHLKHNNIMQEGNGRFGIRSNRLSHKNLEERTTIVKTNRIRIVNKENRQEEHSNIRGGNTGDVARERLTTRNRSNNRNKHFSENMERSTTKNKKFFSNPVNNGARILNVRTRDNERDKLKNSRFLRTEAVNTIRSKSAIRRTETRSTEERRQETEPLNARSMSLRRSRTTEVPDTSNTILRRTVRDISLATRDDPQRALQKNVVRARREELPNGIHMNRNDGVLRENLRNYAPRVTRFQPIAKIEQNDRRIATLLPSEITEGRKLRYAREVMTHERNRLESSRFHRTEAISTIRSKNTITGTETRSTETRQDIVPLTKGSISLRMRRISEVPSTNNNILRRTVRDVSLATRDDYQRVLHRNMVRTGREELLNGRHMNRNDGILRENLRNYAPRVTRFQPIAKIEQNDRRIAILLPSEITEEGRKLRYATYSRSNRLKGISTENRNSKRSVQDRKENRLTIRRTDEREYRLKLNNIGGLSQEREVVQVTKMRDNINNHRSGVNRGVELKKEGDGKSTILDYGARSQLNIRTNRRYLSRTSDRIISEARNMLKINTVELSTRRTIERSDLTTRRLVDRISATSDNKYPDHSPRVKETSNAIQRSFVYLKRRIILSTGRDQRKQRQVTEIGKDREVRNFERNTIFRIKERDTEHWSSHYNRERRFISRMSGMHQNLERDLKRHSSVQMRRDINTLKLRVEYQQNTRYHERYVSDNRDERIKAVRNRLFQLRSNDRLSTEQRTLRNTRLINPGSVTRNVPYLKSDDRTLLNLNRQERMRVTERNGRGFRGKLHILRRYAVNRRMELLKESEPFTQGTKNYESKLSEKIIQGRILRTERSNRDSESYNFEHLSSGIEAIRGSTDRASRRIRVNVLNNVRNSEKRIAGDEIRQRRDSSETNRRVFRERSRNMERHNERKMVNVKTQDSLISLERSDIKQNGNKQNDSPMILRNGRGFRGKQTNFVRMERILKYNYNRNNLFLKVFYRKQDVSVHSQILKPVNGIRFIISRRASQTFSFDRNTGKVRNYERASLENQRNIRNNQRALLENTGKFNSNLNGFVDRKTLHKNVHSTHRNYDEVTIPSKSYYSSNHRASDRILSLNQSPTRRYDIRVERYLENARTESPKIRNRRISEDTKLVNIRQRISNNRLSEDAILPVHGALGSPFTSKDNIYETRLLSSPQIHSSQKVHLNNNENWNMRTVFSLTAHIILGLSIIMAASESDPMKRKSFKQRLFDALSLRTEVF